MIFSKRNQLLMAVLMAVLMVFTPGCGLDSDDDTVTSGNGSQNGNVKPPPSGDSSKLVLGTAAVVKQQTIPADGGIVRVTSSGTALDGLTIEFPSGSYTAGKTIKVSTRPIERHNAGAHFNPLTPLIEVEGAAETADKMIRVRIPAKVPSNHFAMAFYYDPIRQKFEGMPLIDQGPDFVTIVTRHFSSFVVSAIDETQLKNQMPIYSDFLPGVDDFKFANYGSWLRPGGHCAGQSIAAIWYYVQQKSAGEPNLFGLLDNNGGDSTPAIWQDDTYLYKWCSVLQYDIDWADLEVKIEQVFQDANPTKVWQAFAYSILITGEPQLEGMFTDPNEDGRRGGHAMVIYGVEESDDGDQWRLLVADPNYPAKRDRYIYFDETGLLEPYSSGANAQEAASGHGKLYTSIYYIGKTALLPWEIVAQRYEEVLDGVIGEGIFPETTIIISEITDSGNIEIELKDNFHQTTDPLVYLYSMIKTSAGDEGVAYLSVFEGKNSTAPVNVLIDKTYPAKLKEGDNWFGFYTQGMYNNYRKFIDFQWINIYHKPQPVHYFQEYILQDNLRLSEQGFIPAPYTISGYIGAPNLSNIDESLFSVYDASQHFSYNALTIGADVVSKLPFYFEFNLNVDGLWKTHSYTLPNTDDVVLTHTSKRYWLTYEKNDGSEFTGYSTGNTIRIPIDHNSLKSMGQNMGVFSGDISLEYKYQTHVSNPTTGYEYNGEASRGKLFLIFFNIWVTIPALLR